jgi:hypothetical protein
MIVLHLSHHGIPDARVEKTAHTMKSRGWECFLSAGGPSKHCYDSPFYSVYELPRVRGFSAPYHSYPWQKHIKKVKPDVIHAHDIIAARMCFGLKDIPVIYDDHEWWTLNYHLFVKSRKLHKRLAALPTTLRVGNWERRAVQWPTITVNEKIAQHHKDKYGAEWVAITENYPSRRQMSMVPTINAERKGAVYAGNDARPGAKTVVYRNRDEVPSDFEYDKVYGLDWRSYMIRLQKYKVGLIPWKPHKLHQYMSATKMFDYLHAGLQVVAPESSSVPRSRYIHTFDDCRDIPAIVESLPDYNPSVIKYDAHCIFSWETQEKNIVDTYEVALSE